MLESCPLSKLSRHKSLSFEREMENFTCWEYRVDKLQD